VRFTALSRYAIHALVYLARNERDRPIPAGTIADACNVSVYFLMKALETLGEMGIVYGYKGPGGGYSLARTPKEITLLDVVEAVDGPIRGDAKIMDSSDKLGKRLQGILDIAAENYRERLRKVKVSDLAKK
jgi:Rrf2 family protein